MISQSVQVGILHQLVHLVKLLYLLRKVMRSGLLTPIANNFAMNFMTFLLIHRISLHAILRIILYWYIIQRHYPNLASMGCLLQSCLRSSINSIYTQRKGGYGLIYRHMVPQSYLHARLILACACEQIKQYLISKYRGITIPYHG